MQWVDEVKIETPEQIEVDLEVAGLGSRFLAQVIDWALKLVVVLAIVLVGAFVAALVGLEMQQGTLAMLMLALVVAAIYLLMLFVDIYFEARHDGQTPGKMVASIRVIREGGAPCDFAAAAVRNLVGLADFLPMFYLLGGFVALLNKKGQRLGDMAAGTLVIRERALALPHQGMENANWLASDEITFTSQQLATCTPADRHILKSFFDRYTTMGEDSRGRLAHKLAGEFARRTAYQVPAGNDRTLQPECFLASLYRDLQAEARHGR